MKPLRLLLLTAILILTSIVFVSGQVGKNADFDFFAPRKTSYRLQQTGYYGQMSVYDNGQKTRTTNDTYIDVKGTYWLGKGFGAGLGVEADWAGSHPTNSDILSRTWTIEPSVSYGKMLNDRWGAYMRAEVSFGKDKDIYKSSQTNTTNTSDLFGYGATIGFPYRFSKYSAITTTLSFDYSQDKTDDSKQKDNTFGLGIQMEDYLGCSDFKCDAGSGFNLSKGKYHQGRGFINYETGFFVHTGNSETNYTNPPLSFKDKFNDVNFNFSGSYYIVNNLALGGRLIYTGSVQKSDDNAIRYNNNEFDFVPEVIFNMPADNGWRNLFVKGGGYFGSTKSEIKSNNNTTTNKESFTGYNFGLGYYAFFADETALKICTYHRSITYKDKESDDKTRYQGFAAEVGISHWF